MLLNESPYGAGIFPILCTIRQVLRRSFRLIANAIPLPMILRRSFRFPNDRFGLMGVLLGALGDEKSRKGSVTGPICMELGTEKGVLRGGCGREREALGRVRKGEENWERDSDRGWYLCIVNERGTGAAEGWRAKP